MRRLVIMVALAIASAWPVSATVLVPAEFREIVSGAALIVRGLVTDVRALTSPQGDVESVATVAVDLVLKGPSTPFVSVWVPGGSIGRYRSVMVGAPRLEANERAVFFLARGSDNSWRPVGLSSGVVRVEREMSSGRAVVRPPVLLGETAGRGPVVRGDPRRVPIGVDEFESMVRVVMGAQNRRVAVPR